MGWNLFPSTQLAHLFDLLSHSLPITDPLLLHADPDTEILGTARLNWAKRLGESCLLKQSFSDPRKSCLADLLQCKRQKSNEVCIRKEAHLYRCVDDCWTAKSFSFLGRASNHDIRWRCTCSNVFCNSFLSHLASIG